MAVIWFDGNNVLVVFRPHFQLCDRARIIAFAFQLFGFLRILIIGVYVNVVASMLAGMAFENLSVLFQFIAVEVDDFGGSIVGCVTGNHKPEAEGLRENAEIDLVLVLVVRLKARTRIEWQSSFPRVCIVSDVQIPQGTTYVEFFVLAAVWLSVLGSDAGNCNSGRARYYCNKNRTGCD